MLNNVGYRYNDIRFNYRRRILTPYNTQQSHCAMKIVPNLIGQSAIKIKFLCISVIGVVSICTYLFLIIFLEILDPGCFPSFILVMENISFNFSIAYFEKFV